jgi:hypothetical protein
VPSISTHPYPTADEVFAKASLGIAAQISQVKEQLMEQAGKIEFYRLDTKIKDSEIANLAAENRLQAEQIKLLETELKIARIEYDGRKAIQSTFSKENGK